MSRVVMVDIDDTLAATQRSMQKFLRQQFDAHYQFNQLTEDFREGLNRQYRAKIKAFLASPDLVGAVKPFPQSLEAVARLSRDGWQVHIVSSRRENLHNVTRDWLQHHGFTQWIEDYHGRPDHFSGNIFKVRAAQRLGAYAAIDDTLSTALALRDQDIRVLLIQRPWNKTWPGGSMLSRHRNINAAVTHLVSQTVRR